MDQQWMVVDTTISNLLHMVFTFNQSIIVLPEACRWTSCVLDTPGTGLAGVGNKKKGTLVLRGSFLRHSTHHTRQRASHIPWVIRGISQVIDQSASSWTTRVNRNHEPNFSGTWCVSRSSRTTTYHHGGSSWLVWPNKTKRMYVLYSHLASYTRLSSRCMWSNSCSNLLVLKLDR